MLKEEGGKSTVAFGSVRPGVVDTAMQAEIRCADSASFPSLAKFKDMKANAASSSAAAEGALTLEEDGAGAPPAGALDSPAGRR